MVVQLPLLMIWPNSTPSLGLDKLVLGLVRNMGMTSAIYQESSINLNGESMMGLSLSHNATGMRRWTKDTQTQMPQHIIMFIVLTIVRTIVMTIGRITIGRITIVIFLCSCLTGILSNRNIPSLPLEDTVIDSMKVLWVVGFRAKSHQVAPLPSISLAILPR